MLGVNSSSFGMLGVIVCCVCWEFNLLCFKYCVLLFVFSAGRLFLFGVNDSPCVLFVLGGYFLCSRQITTGRPNNSYRNLYVLSLKRSEMLGCHSCEDDNDEDGDSSS